MGDIQIFRKFGLIVKSVRDKISRSVPSGISHVRRFVENSEGERYMHLHNKCTGLAEDLENYRYPEHKEGTDLKLLPLKDGYHDHGCDAVRYFFVNRFPIRKTNMRFTQR